MHVDFNSSAREFLYRYRRLVWQIKRGTQLGAGFSF